METAPLLAPGPQRPSESLQEDSRENLTAEKSRRLTHGEKLASVHSPCIHDCGDGDGDDDDDDDDDDGDDDDPAQAKKDVERKYSSSSISRMPGTRMEYIFPATQQPRSQLSRLIERDRKLNAGKAKGKKHGDR